jgi:hypothetical protein
MPSTINVIPDITSGQLRKSGGSADANLTLQTNSIDAVKIDNAQNANFVSTGAITLPRGTTAQRPSPAVNGMWRYNTSYAYVEVYSNGAWGNLTPILTPISNTAPVVGGSTIVGGVATVTNGTWNNSPTSYTYQWYANSSAITSATANTFTITSTQTGANLSCGVTAINTYGSATANSNSVGPVTATFSIQYLVIAGGGAGGGSDGPPAGGGGAGGYVTNTITGLSAGTVYTATIGAGGPGGVYDSPPSSGSNSTLSGTGLTTVTAIGGGAGGNGRGSPRNGLEGGSGGGAAADNVGVRYGGAGTSGQGNAGSNSNGGYGAGGGGGAGAAGSIGPGGTGIANPIVGSTWGVLSGGSYYVAGGGGAGGSGPGSGGLGGGGSGSYSGSYNDGSPGSDGLGGGGGGAGGGGQQGSVRGGSGVVILSVPTGSFSNTYTGTVTITTSGANTIIIFTGSGTYTT